LGAGQEVRVLDRLHGASAARADLLLGAAENVARAGEGEGGASGRAAVAVDSRRAASSTALRRCWPTVVPLLPPAAARGVLSFHSAMLHSVLPSGVASSNTTVIGRLPGSWVDEVTRIELLLGVLAKFSAITYQRPARTGCTL
jgi:hypothetical protein